jgi:hypothetical protein
MSFTAAEGESVQIILDLRNVDTNHETTLEFAQPTYASWCEWLSGCLEEQVLKSDSGAFRQGFIAEESAQPANRVRRHKGFRQLRLSDVDLLEGIEVADGAYALSAGNEFLFSLLTATPKTMVNLCRLCLSWQSSGLLLTKKRLTVADLESAFRSALQIVPEGRSSSVVWDREAFSRALPDLLVSAGLRGLNIGSTLRYQMACRTAAFDALATALPRS